MNVKPSTSGHFSLRGLMPCDLSKTSTCLKIAAVVAVLFTLITATILFSLSGVHVLMPIGGIAVLATGFLATTALVLLALKISYAQRRVVKRVVNTTANENNALAKLPPEIVYHIYSFLPSDDTISALITCRDWYQRLNESNYIDRLICRDILDLDVGVDKKDILPYGRTSSRWADTFRNWTKGKCDTTQITPKNPNKEDVRFIFLENTPYGFYQKSEYSFIVRKCFGEETFKTITVKEKIVDFDLDEKLLILDEKGMIQIFDLPEGKCLSKIDLKLELQLQVNQRRKIIYHSRINQLTIINNNEVGVYDLNSDQNNTFKKFSTVDLSERKYLRHACTTQNYLLLWSTEGADFKKYLKAYKLDDGSRQSLFDLSVFSTQSISQISTSSDKYFVLIAESIMYKTIWIWEDENKNSLSLKHKIRSLHSSTKSVVIDQNWLFLSTSFEVEVWNILTGKCLIKMQHDNFRQGSKIWANREKLLTCTTTLFGSGRKYELKNFYLPDNQ